MSNPNLDWFTNARFGMFVHFGLYSLLERGEWVMNRERLTADDMDALMKRFNPEHFNADEICDLALEAGMRYICLTTMHHEGFRLYKSDLSQFSAWEACGRDLVEETITAARKRNLRIALYHSLNNWTDKPDAVDALENRDSYDQFIENTFARIKELATRFNPIDTLWYDGWWPFNDEGWQAERMNAMVREIQPHILFNGRNGLPGDFGTPEQHLSPPEPWRPWEGCITLNDNWGYHRGDHHWKSPLWVVDSLAKVANARGNLLLNIGPRGDGSIPEPSIEILKAVGRWIKRNGESVFGTDIFTMGLESREGHASDWNNNGPFTRKGRSLYQLVKSWPGSQLTVAGLNTTVENVELLGVGPCRFDQNAGKVVVSNLPEDPPDDICQVIRLDCKDVPELYLTGGMRIPSVPHPPYDPCPSDIQH